MGDVPTRQTAGGYTQYFYDWSGFGPSWTYTPPGVKRTPASPFQGKPGQLPNTGTPPESQYPFPDRNAQPGTRPQKPTLPGLPGGTGSGSTAGLLGAGKA